MNKCVTLEFCSQIKTLGVIFYKRLYFKSGFLHDVFWSALLSDRSVDCLRSVFTLLHVAIDSVHTRFYEYVHE